MNKTKTTELNYQPQSKCSECLREVLWTLTKGPEGVWYYGDCECDYKTWRAYPQWVIVELEV